MSRHAGENSRGGRGRRERICELLIERGHVNVTDLGRLLNAKVPTIRRDLAKLEAEDAIRRAHGGAYVQAVHGCIESAFAFRMNLRTDAKRCIAKKAATLIENGDTVYIDTGSTALMVAEELADRRSLVVATNSLAVIDVLSAANGIRLFLIGGRYLPHIHGLIGPKAEDCVRAFHFKKMILATAGIDFANCALTSCSPDETPIKQAAMARSERVILVADRSKFGKPSLTHIPPLNGVHVLVTDTPLPPQSLEVLHAISVDVFVVGTPNTRTGGSL